MQVAVPVMGTFAKGTLQGSFSWLVSLNVMPRVTHRCVFATDLSVSVGVQGHSGSSREAGG